MRGFKSEAKKERREKCVFKERKQGRRFLDRDQDLNSPPSHSSIYQFLFPDIFLCSPCSDLVFLPFIFFLLPDYIKTTSHFPVLQFFFLTAAFYLRFFFRRLPYFSLSLRRCVALKCLPCPSPILTLNKAPFLLRYGGNTRSLSEFPLFLFPTPTFYFPRPFSSSLTSFSVITTNFHYHFRSVLVSLNTDSAYRQKKNFLPTLSLHHTR